MIDFLKWAVVALGAILTIGLGTFLAGALALAKRADRERANAAPSRQSPRTPAPADDGRTDVASEDDTEDQFDRPDQGH